METKFNTSSKYVIINLYYPIERIGIIFVADAEDINIVLLL